MSYDASGHSDSDDEFAAPVNLGETALMAAAEIIAGPIEQKDDDWGFSDDIVEKPVVVKQKGPAGQNGVKLEEHLFSMVVASMLGDEAAFGKAEEQVGDLENIPDEMIEGAMKRAHSLLTSGPHQSMIVAVSLPNFVKKFKRSRKTVVGLIQEKYETWGTLLTAVTQPGQKESVLDPLNDKDAMWIVFAPIESAFTAISKNGLLEDLLKPQNAKVLTKLLHGHVAKGAVSRSKGDVDASLQMLSGDVIRLNQRNGIWRLYDGDTLISTVVNDVGTKKPAIYDVKNGTVFAIEQVLLSKALSVVNNRLVLKQDATRPPLERKETQYDVLRGPDGKPLRPAQGTEYTFIPGEPEQEEYAPLPESAFRPNRPAPDAPAEGQRAPPTSRSDLPPPPAGPPPTRLPPPIANAKFGGEFSDDEEEETRPKKTAWFSAPSARSNASVAPKKTQAAPAAPKIGISDDLLARLMGK
jgi:uncharacterized surface protein with fasciclin (FAS1) repeats